MRLSVLTLAYLGRALALLLGIWMVPTSVLADGEESRAIVALESHPASIVLGGPFEYSQLLVRGRDAHGAWIDLTREAELTGADGLLRFDERGLARPLRAGEGKLLLSARGLTHEIPVVVRGLDVAPTPTFLRDVQPVLTRLGCNAGTCHGSAQGKNGFQLSLRGYDAEYDHRSLTDDLAGRRFDPVVPEASLFLRKPTSAVPHEGGKVLESSSEDYALLRAWVAQGARFDRSVTRPVSIRVLPVDPTLTQAGSEQQFAVIATYADGRERDVTAEAFLETSDIEVLDAGERGLVRALRRGEAAVLARYDGRYAASQVVVMGDREGWEDFEEEEWTWVDGLVHEKLRRIRSAPSQLCTDDEFLRRVMLDLTGLVPTPLEVRTFLMDARDSRKKRDEAIDRLIGSAAFVEHWTNRWCDLLSVNSKFLGDEGARRLREWVRTQVASNRPYDEFAHELLGATGSTYENPPAAFWKVQREPDLAMETTTQLFLGVRFNCNKCHDHPFEQWTRDQHWSLAAMLGRVGRENKEGSPMMARMGVEQGPVPAFEEIISDKATGEIEDPDTGEVLSAAFPYRHGGALDSDAPRRQRLAQWFTAPQNPYFARSYVNRLWSYLHGTGLIEPVDDIRAGNPPSNPLLLDRLELEFIESGFDVRHILRTLCRSRAYQRSVATNRWNEGDRANASHALARRLPSEVMHDALHRATGSRSRIKGARRGTRASALVDPKLEAPDGFLDLFGRPARESACECERSDSMSMGQALNLVNGATVAEAVHDPDGELAELARHERDAEGIIEELYLRFLARPATDAELAALKVSFDASEPANVLSLDPEGLAAYRSSRSKWESQFRVAAWEQLEPATYRTSGGSTLTLQDDGSILASGESPETTSTSFAAWIEGEPITGLRLEVLPHDSLPVKGPGRAEKGNFVLNTFRAALIPIHDAGGGAVLELREATSDYSQNGWPVTAAIDADPKSGWGVYPHTGQEHSAVFEVAQDADITRGALLVVTLDQQFGRQHTLGRYRISVTRDARPVRHHGLPTAAAEALRVPAAMRTPDQERALHREYLARHAGLADQIRLGATQDLAWALANSPAFLFNR